MVTYEALIKTVAKGDAELASHQVREALDEGLEARDILRKGLIAGMAIVGERFRAEQMFLPEVLMCADAMHKAFDIIRPMLAESEQRARGTIVIGTVEGDIHDIGKNIVSCVLDGYGFQVIDIGIDVTADAFAQAIEEYKPDVLGMSALLTTTMPNLLKTINLLKERGLREKVKVLIGGVPTSEDFAKSIGADGYAADAISAAEWLQKVIVKSTRR